MSLDVERIELKYRIDELQSLRLRERLSYFLQRDIHGGGGGYMVRSLYFDTLRDTDFEEKLAGCDPRKKIRLRIYDPAEQTVKLELKEKRLGGQRKQTLLLDRETAAELSRGRYEALRGLADPLADRLYLLMRTRAYVPKCVVQYKRIAYRAPVNDIRLTFDSDIRASESDLDLFGPAPPLYPVCGPGSVILEVKYNGFLLSAVKETLGEELPLAASASKYCMARRISKHGRM